jgi:hypothetical protein
MDKLFVLFIFVQAEIEGPQIPDFTTIWCLAYLGRKGGIRFQE